MARSGLLDAFGHVSARVGDGFLVTTTRPLAAAAIGDVVAVDAGGRAPRPRPPTDVPLETPLHAAVYAARPDVGAICRTHSRHAVAWGVRGAVPPLAHGLAGMAGAVALADEYRLITTPELGAAAAAALGDADCLLLRGNGALATGSALTGAAVRAWFLEERARGRRRRRPWRTAPRRRRAPRESGGLARRDRTGLALAGLALRHTRGRPGVLGHQPPRKELTCGLADPAWRSRSPRPRCSHSVWAPRSSNGASSPSLKLPKKTKMTLVLDYIPNAVHAGIYRAVAAATTRRTTSI